VPERLVACRLVACRPVANWLIRDRRSGHGEGYIPQPAATSVPAAAARSTPRSVATGAVSGRLAAQVPGRRTARGGSIGNLLHRIAVAAGDTSMALTERDLLGLGRA
jgi:hypothetical protein